MKLRIKGNSLRLRLTETEVARFGSAGSVSETLAFGSIPQQQLVYKLEKQTGIEALEVSFSGNVITVWVPVELAGQWTETDLVGFDRDITLENGDNLRLLVEKDFSCLHPRKGEDETDAYPHPRK